MIRLATAEEIYNWDEHLKKNPGLAHIYQSRAWAEFKAKQGWETYPLIFDDLAVQILRKKAWGFGNIYYCPKGPTFFKAAKKSEVSQAAFKKFTEEIKDYLLQQDPKAVLLKIDPELLEGELDLQTYGYQKASGDLAFKATILVDLSKSSEDVLESFKQKTRYNIRLAQKKGVQIEKWPMDSKGIDTMYRLMKTTQGRGGFFLRKKSYYQKYWTEFSKNGLGQLFVAVHEGDVLAGVYAFIYGDRAYYKDGGSFNLKRNVMAPYLLQYEVMRWAEEKGAKEYDLLGVPPPEQMNESHPFYGLHQFKAGFNPEVTEYIGSYDLPLHPGRAARWKKWENLFHRLYHSVTRDGFW